MATRYVFFILFFAFAASAETRLEVYQGESDVLSAPFGFGCQLKIKKVDGKVQSYVTTSPQIISSPRMSFRSQDSWIQPMNDFTKVQVRSDRGDLLVTMKNNTGEPVDYELRDAAMPETLISCRKLTLEVAGVVTFALP